MISIRRNRNADIDPQKTIERANTADTISQTSNSEPASSDAGDCYIVGIIVAVVVCILHIIAIAINWWTYYTTTSFGSVLKINSGLWTECTETIPNAGEPDTTCSRIAEPAGYVLDTRSSNTASIILVGLGVVVSMVYRYWQTELHLLILIGGVIFNIAALLTWITVMTFSVNFSKELGHSPNQIHAGWYLALISGLMYHVVSILVVFKRRHSAAAVQPQYGQR